MSDASLFYNKFEIPLTTLNTEEVFDNITDNDDPDYLDSKLIRDVYMPVHLADGTSGRPFWYEYDAEEYYDLIRRIIRHKPVVITYPHGSPEVMQKYIDLGVNEFMVSKWSEDYPALKKKNKSLKIFRSIVGNAYNEDIDERFDAVVIAYKRILDLEWLKAASRKTRLIAIINHSCKAQCANLDTHLEYELKNTRAGEVVGYKCPQSRSFFVPRQVVLKLLPYIDVFKIVDRMQFCFDYEKFIRYYIGREMLNEGNVGTDLISLYKFYSGALIHKLYPHSNLTSLNCRFECTECGKKCF